MSLHDLAPPDVPTDPPDTINVPDDLPTESAAGPEDALHAAGEAARARRAEEV